MKFAKDTESDQSNTSTIWGLDELPPFLRVSHSWRKARVYANLTGIHWQGNNARQK